MSTSETSSRFRFTLSSFGYCNLTFLLVLQGLLWISPSCSATDSLGVINASHLPDKRLVIPPDGRLYHGIFAPINVLNTEYEQVTLEELHKYEQAVDKEVAWALCVFNFTKNENPKQFWKQDFDETTQWIIKENKTPFIRLRLHKKKRNEFQCEEDNGTLQEILDGEFDEGLVNFGKAVRNLKVPVMIEYGPECNGFWNSWSGVLNGGGKLAGYGDPYKADGPERFANAYRHIIDIIRDKAGARNVTWVFHVNQNDNAFKGKPNVKWNRLENYYPGNKYIDWLAVSIYGAQQPDSEETDYAFYETMDRVYSRFTAIAGMKPVILAEFGSTSADYDAKPPAIPGICAEKWAYDALQHILQQNHWDRLAGFAWWNERWQNWHEDKNPPVKKNISNLRVQDNPKLKDVFSRVLKKYKHRIQEEPYLGR